MEEEEIWKDIEGYEGLYKVSNLGNVLSLKRKKPHLLKPVQYTNGYLFVTLSNHNKSLKENSIHRLVAKAFLSNPNNLPQVNHKDEDKTNNRVDNLEWCDAKYNLNYGTTQERKAKAKSKPVLQYDKNGNFLNKYPSASDAEIKTGIYQENICMVCREKLKSTGGYIWKYADD